MNQSEDLMQELEIETKIRIGARVSAAPNASIFYARIVWDGVPYTGAGATRSMALAHLVQIVQKEQT